MSVSVTAYDTNVVHVSDGHTYGMLVHKYVVVCFGYYCMAIRIIRRVCVRAFVNFPNP